MPPHFGRSGATPLAHRHPSLWAAALVGLVACTGDISPLGGNGSPETTGAGGSSSAGPGGPGAGGTSGAGSTGGASGGGTSAGGGASGGGTSAACVPATGDPADAGLTFQCNTCAVPESLPLRRLSKLQYLNALRDVVRSVSDGEDVVNGDLEWHLNQNFPDDTPVGPDKHYGGFTSVNQVVLQGHADGVARIASLVAGRLTGSGGRLKRAVGECAVGASDEACLTGFIRSFGRRALRRPLGDDDVAFYRKPAIAAPYTADDYADVIALLLSAPESLFLVEHGDDKTPATEAVAPLSAHELASRLAFHFWQTTPDEALLASADSGELLTEAGFSAQVDRLFQDPRTRDAMASFFDQWLRNTTLSDPNGYVGNKTFDKLRGPYAPEKDTRARLWDEVTDAALYYTFDKPGSFDSFFRSTRSFARTDDVAKLYGVPVWDGQGEPPDAPGRAGLLTRPALVATGSTGTRPIMKGVYIRKNLLCDKIGEPPANAGTAKPAVEFEDTDSTRQRVEKLTGSGSCAGCHSSLINDLGFATQNFDSLGRLRTSELLLDGDGNEIASPAAIDTSVTPHIDSVTDDTVVANAQELVALMADSPKLDACFARTYFRFTFGRLEDQGAEGKPGADSCALANIERSLRQDSDLSTVLRSVALHPSFKSRSFQ